MDITEPGTHDSGEVREKIRHAMHEVFKEEIADDFDKYKNSRWDSFAHLDLMVALEKEFAVSFTPEEIGSIFSFEDVVNVVSGKLHA